MKKIYLFDLETDNLIDSVSTIHCLVIRDLTTKENFMFKPSEIQLGLSKLSEADILIGHNIGNYDIPVIKKLYPDWNTTADLIDTVQMCYKLWSNIKELDEKLVSEQRLPAELAGKHSLESYGYRLGFLKGTYGKQDKAWDKFSDEMLEYCVNDVLLTEKLFEKILNKTRIIKEKNLEVLHDFKERKSFTY